MQKSSKIKQDNISPSYDLGTHFQILFHQSVVNHFCPQNQVTTANNDQGRLIAEQCIDKLLKLNGKYLFSYIITEAFQNHVLTEIPPANFDCGPSKAS